MINLETVLILGAGASKDFGFPTGRELVEQVCDFLGDQDRQDFNLLKDIAVAENPRQITEAFPIALRRADPLRWIAGLNTIPNSFRREK